jgi:putative transposase
MCRVLGVSTSGFYDWFERPQSPRQQANTKLLACIRDSFAASDKTYGSPRIVRDLQAAGQTCSVNRVARLMQIVGIKARHNLQLRNLSF